MTARPGVGYRQPTVRHTALLFGWHVEEFLEAPTSLNGFRHPATFARTGTRAGVDVAGNAYTVDANLPVLGRWQDPEDSLYKPYLDLAGASEHLYWDFLDIPKALSVYVDLVELGAAAGSDTLVAIGAGTAAQNPRVRIYGNATTYIAEHVTGGGTVTTGAPAGSPTTNQRAELLVTLTSAGVVTLSIKPQGGAITTGTASGSLALGAAYGQARVTLGRHNGTTDAGAVGLRQLKIAAGVQTFAVMQTMF